MNFIYLFEETALGFIDFFLLYFSIFFIYFCSDLFYFFPSTLGFLFLFLVTLGVRLFIWDFSCFLRLVLLQTFLLEQLLLCPIDFGFIMFSFASMYLYPLWLFFSDLLVVLVAYCLASMCLFFWQFFLVISSLMALWLKNTHLLSPSGLMYHLRPVFIRFLPDNLSIYVWRGKSLSPLLCVTVNFSLYIY